MSEMNVDFVKFAAIVYGDGYIARGGRLYFVHTLLQKPYAEFKADFCSKMFGLKPIFRFINCREGCFSTNDSIEVSFHAKHWVKTLRENWYVQSAKMVPPELLAQFGWDEWSFLFQDDGRQNKISHFNTMIGGVRTKTYREPVVNRYEICLGHPTDAELAALVCSLSKLGVHCSVLNRNDGQRNISIYRADAKIMFYNNMLPRIHPSMFYKLNLLPTFTYTS